MKHLFKFTSEKKNTTLIKYFLSYFIILSVLFLGFFFAVRIQFKNVYFKTLNQQTESRLENVKDQFERNITEINQVHSLLVKDINLILSRFREKDWNRLQAAQKMNEYTISNSFIDTIVFIDHKSSLILSSGNYVRYDGEVYQIFANGHYIPFDLNAYPLEAPYQFIYLNDGTTELLLYVPGVSSDAYTIFYIVSDMELKSLMKSTISPEITSVCLNDGAQIISGVNAEPLQKYLTETVSEEQTTLRKDTEENLHVLPLLSGNLYLTAISSNQALLHQVNIAFRNTYLILVLVGLFGLLLILWAMRQTYWPLYKLTKKLVAEPDRTQNYVEQLDQVFASALSEKQSLQDKLDKYRLSMQRSILDSIVTHDIRNNQESFADIDKFFTMDQDSSIFVVKLLPPEPLRETSGDPIPRLFPDSDYYSVVLESTEAYSTYLILFPGNEPEKEKKMRISFESLYEKAGYRAALSNSSSTPLDIPALYENASVASAHLDRSPIVSYGEVETLHPSDSEAYPYKKLDLLTQALHVQNFAAARIQIQELFQLIQESPFPDFFIRFILIDILTVMANTMNGLNIKFKSYDALYFETLYFSRSCPYPEKAEEIRSNINQILDIFETEFGKLSIHASQLRTYIEENYSSPDLSITSLSDAFDVSVTYMSGLFKQYFNQNFSDYVWDRRLERAQKLLTETDLSIEEISLQAGYENPSSFRRKFKQSTSVTPSQYRSKNQKTE